MGNDRANLHAIAFWSSQGSGLIPPADRTSLQRDRHCAASQALLPDLPEAGPGVKAGGNGIWRFDFKIAGGRRECLNLESRIQGFPSAS
jgi:hypothetical protein